MWILVGITAIIIFILWVFIFQGGLSSNANTNSNFFNTLSEKVTDVWQTIKTDILKIQEAIKNENTNESNAEEEKIKELEKKVFPQFTDPTKQ